MGPGVFSERCTEKLPLRVDFIHRVEFGEVSGHRVLIQRGPGNRGPWAVRSEGAYCNTKRIYVSEQPLSNGIVLFGTSPYDAELAKKSFDMAYQYFTKALDIRRSGSAALDLCAIAAGRAELYFELILSPWDYAAGMLLVQEAGGVVMTLDGCMPALNKRSSILARNKKS